MEHNLTLQSRQWPGLEARAELGSCAASPLSPDLAPSDFCFFGPSKNFLTAKRFEDQNALQKPAAQYFTSLGTQYQHEIMFKLVK
jgi:hypothetical protein